MALTDRYKRKIDYVRISVTDRCNFRCRYCMPEEGIPLLDHRDLLTYEELSFLCDTLHRMGVRKVRFTGGEPLVRRGFLGFLRGIRDSMPNLKVALTTNGALLDLYAREIGEIGISGLNVSLDTIQEDKFRYVTRNGELKRVLEGLRASREVGIRSIKVNTVIIRGFNDDEIGDILAFCQENDYLLRLIEFMPMDDGVWSKESFVPAEEILSKVNRGGRWVPFSTGEEVAGPARYYWDPETGQRIGVISAVSSHFCAWCNRVRVSATGKMRACLFAKEETDLRRFIASGDREGLMAAIADTVNSKPRCWEDVATGDLHMSQIGG